METYLYKINMNKPDKKLLTNIKKDVMDRMRLDKRTLLNYESGG